MIFEILYFEGRSRVTNDTLEGAFEFYFWSAALGGFQILDVIHVFESHSYRVLFYLLLLANLFIMSFLLSFILRFLFWSILAFLVLTLTFGYYRWLIFVFVIFFGSWCTFTCMFKFKLFEYMRSQKFIKLFSRFGLHTLVISIIITVKHISLLVTIENMVFWTFHLLDSILRRIVFITTLATSLLFLDLLILILV